MSEPDGLDEQTRSEWDALGFFYDYENSSRTWLIRAERRGMKRLCEKLREYASDSRRAMVSEHEHYGPYSYLKFVTWTEARIGADGIYGRLEDFDRLAEIVEGAVLRARPGERIRVDAAFAAANEATLELLLEPDDFKVASADPALVAGVG